MTWINDRVGKFTASEIWKLFVQPKSKADQEAGKFSQTADNYILMKAIERVTGYRKQFTTKEMEHGIMNEKDGFDSFIRYMGDSTAWKFSSTEFWPIDEESGASPDGVLYDGLDIIAVCDVKCPQPATFFERKVELIESPEDLPKEYYYQLQMQMLATGAKKGYLVYYLAEEFGNTFTGEVEYRFELPIQSRLLVQSVEADPDVHKQIKELVKKAVQRRTYHEQIINNLHNL
jgi:hypothetical protein